MSQRITITLADKLVQAAQQAVSERRSTSVSAYINEAVELRLQRDTRLAALFECINEYEQEHGTISDDERAEIEQKDRDSAANNRAGYQRAG